MIQRVLLKIMVMKSQMKRRGKFLDKKLEEWNKLLEWLKPGV